MGFISIKALSLLFSSLLLFLGRFTFVHCTFNSTEYSDLFRFGVGILFLPVLGWGRIKN